MQKNNNDDQNTAVKTNDLEKYDITNSHGKAYFDDLIERIMSSIVKIEQNQPVYLQVDQKTPDY